MIDDTTPKPTSFSVAYQITKDEGKWAFMTDYTALEYMANTYCRDYVLAREKFNMAGYGFVLPKNAPYKEAFNERYENRPKML